LELKSVIINMKNLLGIEHACPDPSLELWRLVMEPMNVSKVRRSHPEVL
jgi:hypothetical protein